MQWCRNGRAPSLLTNRCLNLLVSCPLGTVQNYPSNCFRWGPSDPFHLNNCCGLLYIFVLQSQLLDLFLKQTTTKNNMVMLFCFLVMPLNACVQWEFGIWRLVCDEALYIQTVSNFKAVEQVQNHSNGYYTLREKSFLLSSFQFLSQTVFLSKFII